MATDTEVRQKPRNDAYTGLLALSFLALIGATVFIYLDAEQLGKPPGKLQIDGPGVIPGKAGDPLQRPDTGKAKIDTGEPKKKDEGMSRAEPVKLPTLPDLDMGGTIVPVKGEERVDPDGPPIPVKPFLPPK